MGPSNWRREGKETQDRKTSISHEEPRHIHGLGSISFEIWTEAHKIWGKQYELKAWN